jgi:hypothetical protein
MAGQNEIGEAFLNCKLMIYSYSHNNNDSYQLWNMGRRSLSQQLRAGGLPRWAHCDIVQLGGWLQQGCGAKPGSSTPECSLQRPGLSNYTESKT